MSLCRGIQTALSLLFLWCACSKPPAGAAESAVSVNRSLEIFSEADYPLEAFGLKLKEPFGLAVDNSGRIYVSDAGNDRVLQLDAELKPVRQTGGFGVDPGLFNRPSFIAVDNGLNVIVADELNRRIVRLNSQLNYVDEIEYYDYDDPLKFGYPSGVAITAYGETWVADRTRNRVAVFNNVGQFDHFLGESGYGGGQLDAPEKIYMDPGLSFIVCDAGNSRLVIYDEYGNYSGEIEKKNLNYPIAVTKIKDDLWVLDGESGELWCIDAAQAVVGRFGPAIPGLKPPLKNPSDIIRLSNDVILIADTGNNRLVRCRIITDRK